MYIRKNKKYHLFLVFFGLFFHHSPKFVLCRPLFLYTTYLTFPETGNYFSCSYILHLTEANKTTYFQRWKLLHMRQVVNYKCFSYCISSHHSHEIKMGFTIRILPHIQKPTSEYYNSDTKYHIRLPNARRQNRLNYNRFGKPSVFLMNCISHCWNFHTAGRDEGQNRSHGYCSCLPPLNKAEGEAWKPKYSMC